VQVHAKGLFRTSPIGSMRIQCRSVHQQRHHVVKVAAKLIQNAKSSLESSGVLAAKRPQG